MTTSKQTIRCGRCNAPIEPKIESEPEGDIGCKSCGEWSPKNEVIQEVKAYVHDAAQVALNRTMAQTAKKSKNLSFKGRTQLNRRYKFIIDGVLN